MSGLDRERELDVAKHILAGMMANPNMVIMYSGRARFQNSKEFGNQPEIYAAEIALKEAKQLMRLWNPPILGNEDK